jgi:hypothetical protein
MSAHMDERIAPLEADYKLVIALLAIANAMGPHVPRTSDRNGCRVADRTSNTTPPRVYILPLHDTNILPPYITHTFTLYTSIVPVHDANILPLYDAHKLPLYVTHTLPPHTNIVPPHTRNSLPPHWRLSDSGQRCRVELGCDQMMTLVYLAMLLTLMGYKLFRTSKL